MRRLILDQDHVDKVKAEARQARDSSGLDLSGQFLLYTIVAAKGSAIPYTHSFPEHEAGWMDYLQAHPNAKDMGPVEEETLRKMDIHEIQYAGVTYGEMDPRCVSDVFFNRADDDREQEVKPATFHSEPVTYFYARPRGERGEDEISRSPHIWF